MTTITQAQYDQLKALLNNNDRVGFYVALHGMTGNKTALLMAQISSNSGIVGGLAWAVNVAYDYLLPGYPPEGVEQFSKDIAIGDLNALKLQPSGGYAVPSEQEMLLVAARIWQEKGLGPWFPGNGVIAMNYVSQGKLSEAAPYLGYALQSAPFMLVGVGDVLWELGDSRLNFGNSIAEFLAENPGSTQAIINAPTGSITVIKNAEGVTIGAFPANVVASLPMQVVQDFISLGNSLNLTLMQFWNNWTNAIGAQPELSSNALYSLFGGSVVYDALRPMAGHLASLSVPELQSLVSHPVMGRVAAGLVEAHALVDGSSVPPEFFRDRALSLIGLEANTSFLVSYGNSNEERFTDGLTGKTFTYAGTGLTSDQVKFAGGTASDLSGGLFSNDRLYGDSRNNDISGDSYIDLLVGFGGDDLLNGGTGRDFLYGGADHDWLGYAQRGLGNESEAEINSVGNVYDGGTGNDRISGARGDDTYIFRKGDGADYVLTHGGADELQLLASADLGNGTTADISEAQVSFKREGLDLLVCINREDGTVGDYVRIAAWFDTGESANALGSVTLRQGVDGPVLRTWPKEEIQGLALNAIGSETSDTLMGLAHYRNVLQGRGGDDILVGANGPVSSTALGDTFIGGADNDHMTGSGSGDTYIYFRGDGHDTILEQDDSFQFPDQLQLLNIRLSDVGFTRTGEDLRVVISGGGSITVKGWFTPGQNRRIENVTFDDASLTADQVTARVGIVLDDGPNNFTGTNGADVIYGMGGIDNLSGDTSSGAADDVLHGGPGDDLLFGGRGVDILYGGADNDRLDGGNGADLLFGGPGQDTLGGAFGQQTYDPGFFPGQGYTWEPVGNTYDGGPDNDRLNGTTGADTYLFNLGWGSDTLYEQDNPNLRVTDVISFGEGISPADIQLSRIGRDLVFSHVNGQDKLTVKDWFGNQTSTVKQVEEVRFKDGTVWRAADLTPVGQTMLGDDNANKLEGLSGYANQLFGFGSADELYGGGYNDLLVGGPGNDYLSGGNADDTYRYFRGDGYDTIYDQAGSDRVIFENINLADAQFFRIGNDLEVFLGTGQGIRVTNHFGAWMGGPAPVEFLIFADQQVSSSQFNAWAKPKG